MSTQKEGHENSFLCGTNYDIEHLVIRHYIYIYSFQVFAQIDREKLLTLLDKDGYDCLSSDQIVSYKLFMV